MANWIRLRRRGFGAAREKHRQFVAVCELCAPTCAAASRQAGREYMATYRWIGNGCPPCNRLVLCKAYIANAVWDFVTTHPHNPGPPDLSTPPLSCYSGDAQG